MNPQSLDSGPSDDMLPDFAVDNGVILLFHSRNAHFRLAVTNPSICQLPAEMIAPAYKYPALCRSPKDDRHDSFHSAY